MPIVHQGFKGHQLHDVLLSPGSADLTADVDFSYLRRMAGGGVACLGPVTQRSFLKNMGIDTRLQVSPVSAVHILYTVYELCDVAVGRWALGLTSECSVQVLLRSCSDSSTRKQLISSYDMLTNAAKMGERFLFFSVLHRSRFARPERSVGLKLEKKSPAQLPVGGFTELSFS